MGLILTWISCVQFSGTKFGRYLDAFLNCSLPEAASPHRDVFPLPLATATEITGVCEGSTEYQRAVLAM
eukprot:11194070-Karenia_brevis.AAC.1